MKALYHYFLLFSCLSLVNLSVRADESDASKYEHCMSLVESSGESAVSYANDWIITGFGGVAAKHCRALGLLVQGKAGDAAREMEKLIDDMTIARTEDPDQMVKNARLKVQIYAQAALAWQQAGDKDKAYMAYSSALSGISPDGPYTGSTALLYELYLDRGTLQIVRGQHKAAVEDLTLAIEKDDRQFEGYLQRAKAYRKRRDFLKARIDLKIAAKIAGDDPDVLLESGILYREQQMTLQARLEWQKIIDLYPQTDTAELARSNLKLLKAD